MLAHTEISVSRTKDVAGYPTVAGPTILARAYLWHRLSRREEARPDALCAPQDPSPVRASGRRRRGMRVRKLRRFRSAGTAQPRRRGPRWGSPTTNNARPRGAQTKRRPSRCCPRLDSSSLRSGRGPPHTRGPKSVLSSRRAGGPDWPQCPSASLNGAGMR